jgi:hypothetical protein
MSSDETFLNDALFEAAREIGDAVTPTDLTQSGIHRVRFVPREKMAALLERAVQRALEKRHANEGGVSQLVGDVQTGLLGLLRGARDVESAWHDIAEQRRALQGEIAEITRERSTPRDPGRSPDTTDTGSQSGPVSDLDVARKIRDRDLTIDRLERRVAKLIATLEATELALQRALVTKYLDTGIASLYRVVQGLSADDPQNQQKREMMKEIFQANLELCAALERDRALFES